jgi:hypothetical protein
MIGQVEIMYEVNPSEGLEVDICKLCEKYNMSEETLYVKKPSAVRSEFLRLHFIFKQICSILKKCHHQRHRHQ